MLQPASLGVMEMRNSLRSLRTAPSRPKSTGAKLNGLKISHPVIIEGTADGMWFELIEAVDGAISEQMAHNSRAGDSADTAFHVMDDAEMTPAPLSLSKAQPQPASNRNLENAGSNGGAIGKALTSVRKASSGSLKRSKSGASNLIATWFSLGNAAKLERRNTTHATQWRKGGLVQPRRHVSSMHRAKPGLSDEESSIRSKSSSSDSVPTIGSLSFEEGDRDTLRTSISTEGSDDMASEHSHTSRSASRLTARNSTRKHDNPAKLQCCKDPRFCEKHTLVQGRCSDAWVMPNRCAHIYTPRMHLQFSYEDLAQSINAARKRTLGVCQQIRLSLEWLDDDIASEEVQNQAVLDLGKPWMELKMMDGALLSDDGLLMKKRRDVVRVKVTGVW